MGRNEGGQHLERRNSVHCPRICFLLVLDDHVHVSVAYLIAVLDRQPGRTKVRSASTARERLKKYKQRCDCEIQGGQTE